MIFEKELNKIKILLSWKEGQRPVLPVNALSALIRLIVSGSELFYFPVRL